VQKDEGSPTNQAAVAEVAKKKNNVFRVTRSYQPAKEVYKRTIAAEAATQKNKKKQKKEGGVIDLTEIESDSD